MAGKKRNAKANLLQKMVQLALQPQSQQQQRSAKPRRRNRRRNRSSIPGGMLSPSLPAAPRMVSSADGLRVKHMEFFCAANTAHAITTFGFDFNKPVLLASLAKVYTRADIHAMSFHYRPSVGTTKDGHIYVAVDWEAADASPRTEAKVKVMQPQIRQPVWGEGSMILPVKRLQEKRNLHVATDKPFALQIALTATNPAIDVGEILISYDLTLSGPSGN